MGVTALVKKANKGKHLFNFNDKNPGLVSAGYEMGVAYATGGLLGELHGRYREKASVGGVPLNLAVGGLAKLAAVVSSAKFGGHGAHTLNTVSNAALATHAFAKGVSHGTEASGRKLLLLEKGVAVPAGLKPTTVVGDIPPAPPGMSLTPEEIAHFARNR